MTSEGREYPRKEDEEQSEAIDSKEIERVVRDAIEDSEVNNETEDERERPPDEDIQDEIRKAINDVETSSETGYEHDESNDEEVERVVREAIREMEEQEQRKKDKERQREDSRSQREQTAEEESLDKLEEVIIESMQEQGLDSDEIRRRWRERFEKDVEEELEKDETRAEDTEDDDKGVKSSNTEVDVSCHTDGSGQAYIMTSPSSETTESGVENESDPSEVEEQDKEEDSNSHEKKVDVQEENVRSKRLGENESEEGPSVNQNDSEVSQRISEDKVQDDNPREDFESNHGENKDREDQKETELKRAQSSEIDEQEKDNSKFEGDKYHEDRENQSEKESEEDSEQHDYNVRTSGWPEHYYDKAEEDEGAKHIRKLFESLTEEEKERFREFLRNMVKDKEDFDKLAQKHGLSDLIQDEETLEEISKYLEFRSRLNQEGITEDNIDEVIGSLSSELGIHPETGRQWGINEGMPEGLKDLLNREGDWIWREIVRRSFESQFTESEEELEETFYRSEELLQHPEMESRRADMSAWIEILRIRRNRELDFVVRNGVEMYRYDQIWDLSLKYHIPEEKILRWLRGESIPLLAREILRVQKEAREFHSGELLGSIPEYEQALRNQSWLRFYSSFDEKHQQVMAYFTLLRELEQGPVDLKRFSERWRISVSLLRKWAKREAEPHLLRDLRSLEIRRMYTEVHEGVSRISIESMEDVIRLATKHRMLEELDYEMCEKYFSIITEPDLLLREASEKYDVSDTTISRWRGDIEVGEIAKLRRLEERRVIENWAKKSNPRIAIKNKTFKKLRKPTKEEITLWKPNDDKLSPYKFYGGLYFYFRDRRAFADFFTELKGALEGTRRGGLTSTVERVEHLISQVFHAEEKIIRINTNIPRIKGEYFEFLNYILGKSLQDYEGIITKLAPENGIGGFENPRFPEREILLVTFAQILAIVVCDGNMRDSGIITFFEPELVRHDIFEVILQRLGDISLEPRWDDERNYYMSYIPGPIGRALQSLGLPPNDKTIHNPSIDVSMFEESERALRAIIEESIPQDGTVVKRAISWTFSNALNAGDKREAYDFEPIVYGKEIEFIKREGNPYDEGWTLAWGHLKKLTKISNKKIARIALSIKKKIQQNPNNLVRDMKEVAGFLGVELAVSPAIIRYLKKTGRVTVAWYAKTKTIDEMIKLGLIAPPNDIKKRTILKDFLWDKIDRVLEIKTMLDEQQIVTSDWWREK